MSLPPSTQMVEYVSGGVTSIAFASSPTYAQPFVQSNPPCNDTLPGTTSASVHVSAQAYTWPEPLAASSIACVNEATGAAWVPSFASLPMPALTQIPHSAPTGPS